MSSKFLIELGQGTVSVSGEEEFVKAAFCALQSILIPSGAAGGQTAKAESTSKFSIELGHGIVSVDGEEEFVKAAFGALQAILTTVGSNAGSNTGATPTAVTASEPSTSVESLTSSAPANSPAPSSDATEKMSGVEEFGSPGEILERIRDSLNSDEDDKEAAVA